MPTSYDRVTWIKRFREITGEGLAVAKTAYDDAQSSGSLTPELAAAAYARRERIMDESNAVKKYRFHVLLNCGKTISPDPVDASFTDIHAMLMKNVGSSSGNIRIGHDYFAVSQIAHITFTEV